MKNQNREACKKADQKSDQKADKKADRSKGLKGANRGANPMIRPFSLRRPYNDGRRRGSVGRTKTASRA
ncbi:hypothetical protein [Bordetella bronchialis]|uniref:hypothetical protein n=1 Tax=Bordetella bronchialis TaxID=463025 RepID=UPI0012EA1A11|nr:hypothetical protein [Bordetella bronchialis]